MIALLVFFFANYIPDRCRSHFQHDCLLPDCGTNMLRSQHSGTFEHLTHECCTGIASETKGTLMAAYFIVDIQEITDPQTYAEYRKGVDATLEPYGGTFRVRGGTYETIEGDWQSQRLVVVEFADVQQFKRWYNSPEYSELLKLRLNASTSRAVVVQGI